MIFGSLIIGCFPAATIAWVGTHAEGSGRDIF